MAKLSRIDCELVRRSLARSRQHASQLISDGLVYVDGIQVLKPARQINPAQAVLVKESAENDFVSRGAFKLIGALKYLGDKAPTICGKNCLDAGASTGGFTEVLLRNGANKVIAADVGYGQLAWKLRSDDRVIVKDRTNLRFITKSQVEFLPEIIVGDLSFISLKLLIKPLVDISAEECEFLLMVKPQFEIGKDKLSHSGVVKDPLEHIQTVLSVAKCAIENGLRIYGVAPSPLPGLPETWNIFLAMNKSCEDYLENANLEEAVYEAVKNGQLEIGCNMRRVLMVVHKKRESAKELALHATEELAKHNIEVIDVDNFKEGIEFELILVLGGDGSLLSAAYYSRKYDIPMIGINLGHVGFLAEMDPEDISVVVEKIAKKDYTIQLRTTLEITITKPDGTILKDWALNEAALSRKDHVHPAYVSIGVDDEPISTFGGDGVIFATPTGSTAYAFSAGGLLFGPDVDALVMVPLAGHALFTKPLIVGTNSKLQATVLPDQWADLALCCDGTRVTDVPGNSQVSVVASDKKIKLARMHNTPFSSRLVARFNLPVEGWRSTNSGEKNKK